MNTHASAGLPVMLLVFVAIATTTPSTSNAQSSAADAAWANILSLSAPAPISRHANGHAKPQIEFETEIAQRAANLRQAAQAAHDFYLMFPADLHAAEARKIEALCMLRGAGASNATAVQTALAVARSYRQDSIAPAADRFEVALAMDRLDLSVRARGGISAGDTSDRRLLADNLRAEFGDLPALQDYYMEIARSADDATAAIIAADVRRSPAASRGARDRAQTILDRVGLVGRQLHLQLNELDGSTVGLAQGRGRPTLVIAWAAAEGDVLLKLLQHRHRLQNAELIYVGLGGSIADLTDAKQRFVTMPGAYCHAPAGSESRRAIDGLKLQYAPLPRVYVLDASGLVLGSGSVAELPALLTTAGL